MILPIVAYGSPVLRKVCQDITADYPGLDTLISDMWETMHVSDGIGLAGPQVGIAKKIAVIEYNGEKYVLINPEISERENIKTVEEGCLSFPGIYEKVESPEYIKVRYFNENEELIEKEIEGFLACVFSHEIDHLNGKLLIDRVSPLKRQFLKKKMAKQAKENSNG